MAKQIIESLIDDLDGSPATQTILVGIDGVMVSLDLNDKNANVLRTLMNPYLENGRRVRSGGAGRGATKARGTDKDRNQTIRQWALDSGVELPTRGRIAMAVQDAYDAKDVPALFAAAGLEMEPEDRPRRRGRTAEFSAAA